MKKLSTLSTMALGGDSHSHIILSSDQLLDFFSEQKNKNWMILGEGSNTVFGENNRNLTILQISNKEITIEGKDDTRVQLRAETALSWDSLVEYCVENYFAGIEALSSIPGSVGAAPVQNIGAYGAEFADACLEVDVFDTHDCVYKTFTKEDCEFSYRNSIFKKDKKRYIVISVLLELSLSKTASVPDYPGVSELLKGENANISDIRNTISSIRASKLPNPKEIANCGSFFKNSILSKEEYKSRKEKLEKAPVYETEDGFKVSAAWLIDQAGLKGFCVGDMCTSSKHALVIINKGKGTFSDFQELIHVIISSVESKFDITLEPEVQIVNNI
ncbi:MAG: UDP-N-acetylmuramate dehydrogenase [Flavobacteriaceae bacterium]|jgi:UDP-N-acetylmuramate dehydrogenase